MDAATKALRLTGLVAAAWLFLPSAPLAHAATQPPKAAATSQADYARIDGFRDARFGMDTDEVKRAIEREFHVGPAEIRVGRNPVQRTDVLGVRIRNLAPGTGTAIVSYVFGYRSHRLIEVNVLWAEKADPKANAPKTLEAAGASLQSYFVAERFPKGRATANVALPNGTLILFRGIDPAGHAVVLALNGKLSKSDKPKHVTMTPTILSLVYASDPTHPDVFHIKKGSF